MLLVLPISRSDAKLSEVVQKSFEKFSPGPNHTLLILASLNAKEDADLLLNNIHKHFVKSAVHVIPSDNPYDWPRACNHYFQQACFSLFRYIAPNQGWLWYEMDTMPMTQNWLTILEKEYYADSTRAFREGRTAHRYMGAREKTIKAYGGESMEAGHHMASVGIYPGDIAQACPVLKSIPSLNVHFSSHIKWYPLKSFNESPLIQNNRETANYRIEGDEIICDSIARNAFDVHFNKPVSKDAVILHGCKDGSLLDLLPADRTVFVPETPAPIPAAKPDSKPYFQHISPFAGELAPPKQVAPESNPVHPPNVPTDPKAAPIEHFKGEHGVVKKFGEHLASGRAKNGAQFDESGMLVAPATSAIPTIGNTDITPAIAPISGQIAPIQAPAPSVPTEPPQPHPTPTQNTQLKRKRNSAKAKAARKALNLSPEERQRRSDRMRQIVASRKSPALVP